MTNLSPASQSHLKVLAILHYVMAAFGAFGLAMIAVYGVVLLNLDPAMFDNAREAQQWEAISPIIYWILGGVAVFTVAGISLNVWAGRCLQKVSGRGWIIAASAWNALNFPLGMALAVFTLVVVFRHEVSEAMSQAKTGAQS